MRNIIITTITIFAVSAALAADTPTTPTQNAQLSEFAQGKEAVAKKDFKTAVEKFTEASKKDPKNADVLTMLGYSVWNENIKNKDKAIEYYQQALKINSNHIGANHYLGKLYVMLNEMDKANVQLAKLDKICGFESCPEYKDLKNTIKKGGKNARLDY